MRVSGIILAFLGGLASAGTGAGLPGVLDMSLEELANLPVSTASRTTERWREAQGSLHVITARQIRERGYRHIADLLRDLPSVDMQGPYNTSSRLTVRGVTGNTKMLVLQDGVRIGAPAGELMPLSINFPLYMARQVEVLLTPGSALYGADAVSGVINIITVAPGEAQDDRQRFVYEGSESTYQHGHLQVRGRVGRLPISIGAQTETFNNAAVAEKYPEYYRLDDLRNESGQVVISAADRHAYRSKAESTSVWGRMDLGDGWEAGAGYRAVRYPNDATTRPEYVNYGGVWGERLLNVHARYIRRLKPGLDSNTLLAWSTYRLDPASYFDNLFSNYRPGYKYAESRKLQLDSQWDYRLSESHVLTGGLVAEQIEAIPRSTDLTQPYDQQSSPLYQPLYYPGTNGSLPVKLFRVEQDNYALFLQDRREWTSRLGSQLGIRYDRNSDYGGNVSPYAGIRFDGSDTLSLGLTLSQAFLAPSPSYSYEHFGSFTGQQDAQGRYIANSFRIPNPELQPEEIRAAEGRLEWKPDENNRLTLTAYRSSLRNLILYARNTSPPQSGFIPGGVLLKTSQNVNLGDSVAWGAEAGYAGRKPFGRGVWESRANVSYTTGRLHGPSGGEPLPYTAPGKLKLGGTWTSRQGWFLSPSVVVSGESRVPSSAGKNQRLTVPGYGVLNLYAGWEEWRPGLGLSLRVENLTDRRYYHAGGTSTQSLVRLPQPGRVWTLGAEVRF